MPRRCACAAWWICLPEPQQHPGTGPAGMRGQRVRVAVIDGDFRGWEELVGRRLPRATRYLDLTAERSDLLQPDPQPAIIRRLQSIRHVTMRSPTVCYSMYRRRWGS